MLPRGVCRVDFSKNRIVPKSLVTLAGQGMGVTIVLIDDQNGNTDGIGNTTGGGNRFAPLDHFTLRGMTVQGRADTIHTPGGQVIRLSGTNLLIERVESRYSRNIGMVISNADNATVHDCRVFRSMADGIAVWDTSNAIITGNVIRRAMTKGIPVEAMGNAPQGSTVPIAVRTCTPSRRAAPGLLPQTSPRRHCPPVAAWSSHSRGKAAPMRSPPLSRRAR
jgi:parallel beta-helix repeat protein